MNILNFKAELRPYQIKGYKKLHKNLIEGNGTLLADDMGLGKTLQIIALVQDLKNKNKIPIDNNILLIVPKSLIGNWKQEIEKFAPTLNIQKFEDINHVVSCDILLATYGEVYFNIKRLLLAQNSKEQLSEEDFELSCNVQKKKHYLIILDEAQKIKNFNARITKVLKGLKANYKIAITGTPLENTIGEFASILHFVNPALLDYFSVLCDNPTKENRDKFLENIAPFIIRRLKRHKKIIKDLPPKLIRDEKCQITHMQKQYLKKVPKDVYKVLRSSHKRGCMNAYHLLRVLFVKQILNHPASYRFGPEKQHITLDQSGKLMALRTIIEKRPDSKILISTQFVKMGALLVKLLKTELGLDSFFLHGNLCSADRSELVNKFQNPNSTTRIFIVSAKAGGTGLNLTAANTVIFLDRLWNPSIHKQIMDRTHRIGQQKDIEVIFLVSKHKIEKRTSNILQQKQDLFSFCFKEPKEKYYKLKFKDNNDEHPEENSKLKIFDLHAFDYRK